MQTHLTSSHPPHPPFQPIPGNKTLSQKQSEKPALHGKHNPINSHLNTHKNTLQSSQEGWAAVKRSLIDNRVRPPFGGDAFLPRLYNLYFFSPSYLLLKTPPFPPKAINWSRVWIELNCRSFRATLFQGAEIQQLIYLFPLEKLNF